VTQQAPEGFLLQPNDCYPMIQADFDRWVAVLNVNFPDYLPRLAEIGHQFFPVSPEELKIREDAAARAHAASHPVVEMRDQDGARCHFPERRQVNDWIDVMTPGDTLLFLRNDGGTLDLTDVSGECFRLHCTDARGGVAAKGEALTGSATREAVYEYLDGDTAGCVNRIRQASKKFLAPL
jgi:hypothetical protein